MKIDSVVDLVSRSPSSDPDNVLSVSDEVQLLCTRCNNKKFEVVWFAGEHSPRFVCACGFRWPCKLPSC